MDNINTFIRKALTNNGKGWTVGSIIKTAVLVVVALFALSIVLAMFKWVFGIGGGNGDYGRNNIGIRQMMEEPEMMIEYAEDMMDGNFSMNRGYATAGGYGGSDTDEASYSSYSQSAKMVAPSGIPMADITSSYAPEPASRDAEDYETREYTARYEERDISAVCNEFEALKPLEYVVFENATQSDEYCNYRFKVEVENEDEVIALIKTLDPKSFNESTFTLERTITNNNNEVEILQKKVIMLDTLLTNARTKYAALRTSGNAEALVQAINNEINLIERVTNQKLTVQSRIDRLTNSTGVQEERIDYSQFNVSVSERKLINWDNISDNWKYALERFIANVSEMVQDLTIGLVMFVLGLVKFIIYISVVVVATVTTARFLWAMSRRIWRG